MEIVGILLFLMLVGAASGIRFVPTGNKAVLVRLGKRSARTEHHYDEGITWIIPLIDRLQILQCGTRTVTLTNFPVQTGTGLSILASVSCEWDLDPRQLYSFASVSDPGRTIESHIKDTLSKFARFISISRDIYSGEMLVKMGDTLFTSLELRCAGKAQKFEGDSWSNLRVVEGSSRLPSLGITIHDMDIISVDLSPTVRDAHERNKAGEIDADTLEKTTPAIANAIRESVRAGGSAEISQLQTERTLLPHGKRTEPPNYNQVYVSGQNLNPFVPAFEPKPVLPGQIEGSADGKKESDPPRE